MRRLGFWAGRVYCLWAMHSEQPSKEDPAWIDGSVPPAKAGAWGHFCLPAPRANNFGFRLALSPSGVSPEVGQIQGAKPSGESPMGVQPEPRPEAP
jgi:hypothetical protein